MARLDATKDKDIDYSEIPELGEEFFVKAKLLNAKQGVRAVSKVSVTARLDGDVVAWLRKTGPGYQTRMNAILRAAMESQPKRRAKKAS